MLAQSMHNCLSPCKVLLALAFITCSCTISFTQISTKGTASDVVDSAQTPTSTVNATATIPASVLP